MIYRLPPDSELAQGHRSAVTVAGVITEIDPDRRNSQGARHQILSLRVDEVRDDVKHTGVAVGEVINVAIRYGDSVGLAKPVPGLAVGQQLALHGAYVVLQAAYAEPDGDRAAVIHYTHHPLGWVEYQGQHYE